MDGSAAAQRFHADDFAGVQCDLWLIVKLYFAPVDCASQVFRDSDALLDLTVQGRIVKAEAVAAFLFRAIEREVRLESS